MMMLFFANRPKQPRGIDPDERALIDAAVAEGKVRRIPPGVSGIPLPVWNPDENKLCDPDRRTAVQKHKEVAARHFETAARNFAKHRERQANAGWERRQTALRLRADGLSYKLIAEQMGCTKQAVNSLIRDANRRGETLTTSPAPADG